MSDKTNYHTRIRMLCGEFKSLASKMKKYEFSNLFIDQKIQSSHYGNICFSILINKLIFPAVIKSSFMNQILINTNVNHEIINEN